MLRKLKFMQNSGFLIKKRVFVKKNLKINILKVKSIDKLEASVIIQVNIKVVHIAYVI